MRLFQIESSYFVAGLEYDEQTDRVTRAAPIIHYITGWSSKRLLEYVLKKGWIIDDAINPRFS
jgi:hypothetical protein